MYKIVTQIVPYVTLGFFFIFYNISPALSQNKKGQLDNKVLIINQIRGTDFATDKLFPNTQYLLSNSAHKKIPIFYTVRYDALVDEKITSLLTTFTTEKLGVLVEVTPQLAVAANVPYRGNNDNWYKAQHLFLVGYTLEERKKLIDTLLTTFETKLGYFPELATSWAIDTESARYLGTKGVKTIEITKEQWGTDSYTLTGGPHHYPYLPSSSWIFTPTADTSTKMPIILRQTVDDPLRNYADRTNAFTTQPNDYILDGKKIDYFKKLLSQALIQQPEGQSGFALLGIENTMDRIHLDEFLTQLDYVKNSNFQTISSLTELDKIARQNSTYLYCGNEIIDNENQSSCWVGTDKYKARFRQDNNSVFISDLRIYDESITDQYENKIAEEGSYFVQPFVLDGQYEIVIPKRKLEPKSVSTLLKKEEIRSKLSFPSKKTSTSLKWLKVNNIITLSYTKKDGTPIKIKFTNDKIIYENKKANISDINYDNKDGYPIKIKRSATSTSLNWQNDKKEVLYGLNIDCYKDKCTLIPNINQEIFMESRRDFYQYFLPEPNSGASDNQMVKARIHNTHAMVNRNPVRILVNRFDKYGIPSGLSEDLVVETGSDTVVKQSDSTIHVGQKIIDLYSSSIKRDKVIIKSPQGDTLLSGTIYFVPNCKQEVKKCLFSPFWAMHYILTILSDKTRDLVLPDFF